MMKDLRFKIYDLRFTIHDSRFKKGFTLIELLIVIAIIGILATLLMSNFIGIRQRARDGRRKSDISQIQAALEQYRADNSQYPTSIPSCINPLVYPPGCTLGTSGCLVYMQKIPCDPFQESGQSYYNSGSYYYSGSATSYVLAACLENVGDTQGTTASPSNGVGGCSSSTYYVVRNP